MGHTYSNLLTHALFSTKHRDPLITPDVKADLHAYLCGILKRLKCTPIVVGGVADHVHLLFVMPPTVPLAKVMQTIKANSSGWMRQKGHLSFAWQEGYTAFAVSESNRARVRAYIANQERHHKKLSFKEELIAFLKKHGMAHDERFVWD